MAFCRDTYLVRDDELLPVGRVDVPELRVPELLELPERVLVLELRVLLLVLLLELRELLRAGCADDERVVLVVPEVRTRVVVVFSAEDCVRAADGWRTVLDELCVRLELELVLVLAAG